MVIRHVYISGKVQGVSFRYHTYERASKLNITGWVRNLEDGRVEVVAVAKNQEAMDELLSFLKVGPSRAEVKAIEINEVQGREGDFKDFSIRRDGGPTW